MLIVRAPVRVSLGGGGTDLPAYYERHGGLVVSTSINRYVYVFVNPNGADHLQVSSSDFGAFFRHRAGEPFFFDGDLGLVKSVLDDFGLDRGIELFLASEVPPRTGLGSSSAVAVALVKAFGTLRGFSMTPDQIAERACSIEIGRLCAPVGKQDQYAAAFGGLNAITFHRHGVTVEPLSIDPETRARLERNLLLFSTGSTRSVDRLRRQQQQASRDDRHDAVSALHTLKQLAHEMRDCLEQGDLSRFGALLAESWEHKKRLATGISNPRVDELYRLARRHGALGGKITGSGGGGFLMLYCEAQHQESVTQVLEDAGMSRMDFQFEHGGVQVLLNALPSAAIWVAAEHPVLDAARHEQQFSTL